MTKQLADIEPGRVQRRQMQGQPRQDAIGVGVPTGEVDTEGREFELQPTIKPAVPATAILRNDCREMYLFSRSMCSLIIIFPPQTLVHGFLSANLPAEQDTCRFGPDG
jgi:hypothetical protein